MHIWMLPPSPLRVDVDYECPKGITVQFKILNVLELIMSLFVNVRMVSKEMVQNLVYLKVSLKKKMVRKHTYMNDVQFGVILTPYLLCRLY